jgi:hypothetical protein
MPHAALQVAEAIRAAAVVDKAPHANCMTTLVPQHKLGLLIKNLRALKSL